jgi:hypothetical protein
MFSISARDYLRSLCSINNMTHRGLSRLMGRNPSYIDTLASQHGFVKLNTAVRACNALGLNLAIIDKDSNILAVVTDEDAEK